jgi:hypothetical protein
MIKASNVIRLAMRIGQLANYLAINAKLEYAINWGI